MVAITAQQIFDESTYSESSEGLSKTNVEYLIDNAINWINLVAGTSISNLSGVAESKTVTVTSAQSAVIKPLVHLLLRARQDKGPGVATSGVNVAEVTSDPQYRVNMMLINRGLQYLRGRSFERV